jgi:thiol-disulfide isomerase/thioredoxin
MAVPPKGIAVFCVVCYTAVPVISHLHMKKLLALSALVVLVACTPGTDRTNTDVTPNDDTQNMMIEDNDPSNDDDDMVDTNNESMTDHAVYTAYSADVLTNGKPKVLFFHAAWCPICRNADTKMQAWYSDGHPALDSYKVDYDTEMELKARYGVTYQHTYVLVDGQGNAVQTLQGPSEDELMALVGA